jgi:hypothetical protein
MADSTKKALEDSLAKNWKLETKPRVFVKALDARKIGFEKSALQNAAIVTEGYLGEILTQRTATPERIATQKRHLSDIYSGFFEGLAHVRFHNPIVMCIPFWDIGGKFTFFEEFYEILKRFGFYSEKLLPQGLDVYPTKFGSLLYRRPGQTVGREIVRIVPGRRLSGERPESGFSRSRR